MGKYSSSREIVGAMKENLLARNQRASPGTTISMYGDNFGYNRPVFKHGT
jgi:hypothetical protein